MASGGRLSSDRARSRWPGPMLRSSRVPAAALGIPFGANSAILFGGESSSGAGLSDTWLFTGDAPPSGATVAYGNWSEDTSTPMPPGLFGAAATSDFAESRAVLFGGEAGPFYAPQGTTWGYFHPVAILTVSAAELRAGTNESFQAYAAGGAPPYTFSYQALPPGARAGTSPISPASPAASACTT